MLKKFTCIYRPALIVVILISAGFVFAGPKKSIKTLTSKSSAQKIQKDIPAPKERVTPRVPSRIHVHSVGIGLGQTVLGGDFRDEADDALGAELYYTYSASHSFDVLANLHYTHHKFKNRIVNLPGLALGIKGRLYQFDSFAPYLLGGFGFYKPAVRREIDGVMTDSRKKIVFGYHVGAGIELRLNRHMSVGGLFHVHNPFDVKQEVGNEIEGYYAKLLITVMYRF